jgi:uncharacterized repeat protein (TIGR01451 family)
MKNAIGLIVFILAASSCYAQLAGIEIDTVMVHNGTTADGVDLTGYTTYRLYAVCTNENDIVKGMNASTTISSLNGVIWQSDYGDHFSTGISCSDLLNYPSSAYDTWVTVGGTDGCTNPAALVSYNCGGFNGNWVSDFENSGYINFWSMWEGCNGSYASTNYTDGLAGPDLRVLLAQFTCTGPLMARVTVQMFIGGDTSVTAWEYACNTSDDNIVQGCMDAEACNFDPLATWDNCTCIDSGCTDSSACNFDSEATCDNGSCIYGEEGCGYMYACNYDPNAVCVNNALCIYVGCTNPEACNYSASAGCDNGSCFIGSIVRGYVFYDPTPNITWNNAPASNGMSAVALHMMPEDIWVLSDATGYYEFPAVEDGTHNIQVSLPEGDFMFAEDGYMVFTTPYCNMQHYGISPTGGGPFAIVTPTQMNMPMLHCTNGGTQGLWLHNTGNTMMTGVLTIEFNPLLVAINGPNPLALDPANIADDSLVWQISSMQPGEEILLQYFVAGPGTEAIGSSFQFDYHLQLFDDTLGIFIDTTWQVVLPVLCAYDPNDKTAVPAGMDEANYVLPGDTIDYQIRFQNTGNYPAERVVIADTLDASFDWTSLETIVSSHAMVLQMEPDGIFRFVFNDINLPDSTSDEAGSHGFVRFRVRLLQDLPIDDIIENTAFIYFDENPTIITNTTTHHLFDCNWLGLDQDSVNSCDPIFQWHGSTVYTPENWEWWLNDVLLPDSTADVLLSVDNAINSLQLVASNALCAVESDVNVQVELCENTTLTLQNEWLVGPPGYVYEWHVSNMVIDDVTGNVINPGDYVQDKINVYAVLTSPNGCICTTPVFYSIGVEQLTQRNAGIFPNPASQMVHLINDQVPTSWRIYHATGQLIHEFYATQSTMPLDVSDWSNGVYTCVATSPTGQITSLRLAVYR